MFEVKYVFNFFIFSERFSTYFIPSSKGDDIDVASAEPL